MFNFFVIKINNDLINCIFRKNRVVYRTEYSFFKKSEKLFSIFLGQILFLSRNNIDYETGLGNKKLSDIIFNTSWYFSKNFEVYFDSVFCHQKSKFLRSDIASKITIGNADIYFGFSFGNMYNKNTAASISIVLLIKNSYQISRYQIEYITYNNFTRKSN